MPRVCPQCGTWNEQEPIDQSIPAVICTVCQHPQKFLQLPLFIINGASATGKTTLSEQLPYLLPECVTLDTDTLWGIIPANSDDDYVSYQDHWLRLARDISQSGRPVVLCGSTMPQRIQKGTQQHYFSSIHHLALVCDDEILVQRLKARPAWRGASKPDVIDAMLGYNRWLKDNTHVTNPPTTLYDTTHSSVTQTLTDIMQWIRARLPQ